MAILRIFNEREGSRDVPLNNKRLIIGREAGFADCIIPDSTVSRMHAMIYEDGKNYVIKDMDSTAGTLVNRHRINSVPLKDHDTIQIGSTVIEFIRKNPELPTVLSPDANDENMMTISSIDDRYRPIPGGMGLSCRIVHVDPHKAFNPGDTVRIGGGGIMIYRIPCKESIFKVILELEFIWPDGRKKTLHGEVEHDLPSRNMVCIKLHGVSQNRYATLMEGAKRGSWIVLQKPL